MKVQHAGSEPVYLAAQGDWVQPKEEVEVTDEVGASLVEQGWISARSKAAKKVARKRAAAKKAAPPAPEPEPDPAPAEQED